MELISHQELEIFAWAIYVVIPVVSIFGLMFACYCGGRDCQVQKIFSITMYCCMWYYIIFDLSLGIHPIPSHQFRNAPYTLAPLIWIIQLIESRFSNVRYYFTEMGSRSNFDDILSEMRSTNPTITFHIKCYHYETYYLPTRDGGWDRKRKTVTTHTATYEYPYDHHRDISDDTCEGIRKNGVTRVELTADIQPGDVDTKNHLNFEFNNFVSLNDLDAEKTETITKKIPGMESHVSVCKGRRPYWMNTTFLYLSTFCFMGWPYKAIFYWSTGKTSYEFKKEFFVNLQDLQDGPDNSSSSSSDDNNAAPVVVNINNIINPPPPMHPGMQFQPTGCNNLPYNQPMNPGIMERQLSGNDLPYNPPMNRGMELQSTGMEIQSTGNDLPYNPPMNPGMEPQPTGNDLPYPTMTSGMELQPTAPPINPGMELESTGNDIPWQKPPLASPDSPSSKNGDEQDEVQPSTAWGGVDPPLPSV